MPDDLGATHRLLVVGQPHVDEGVDHRIQLLLGRIPRLEQVVIKVDDVDRLNGRLGIGVGGEKRPTRMGKRSIASSRNSRPLISGILWSASITATQSPRSFNSRSVSSASAPDSVRTIRYDSP